MMEFLDYTFRSKSGLLVNIRPLEPEDGPHLVELFRNLGTQSRLQRFSHPLRRVSASRVWQEARRVARLTLPEGYGFLAFADLPEQQQAPVAVVRYQRVPPDEAEVALSVRDDVQGTGIGTYLLKLLAAHARAHGIRRLFALIRDDNRFLYHLLGHSPFPVTHIPHGQYAYIVVDLHAGHGLRER